MKPLALLVVSFQHQNVSNVNLEYGKLGTLNCLKTFSSNMQLACPATLHEGKCAALGTACYTKIRGKCLSVLT